MHGEEKDVYRTMNDPDEIRRSKKAADIFLFYKCISMNRWICCVVKKIDGEGFLITTYPTDNIKKGEVIWRK